VDLNSDQIADLREWHRLLLLGDDRAWAPTGACYRVGLLMEALEEQYEVDPNAPDEPEPEAPVLAASTWASNAEVIEAAVKLGYLHPNWSTIDPTYGLGVWWKRWRPTNLVTHDLDREKGDGVDFHHLPHDDDSFDAAVFDPAYVPMGGTETSTLPDYNARFGRMTAPKTPVEMLAYNLAGLAEVGRVVRSRNYRRGYRAGFVLVKASDYVWCGNVVPGIHQMLTGALDMGFSYVQSLVHVGRIRPQPTRTRKGPPGPDGEETRLASSQQHAYSNYSTLLVLRTPRYEAPTLL
jgi:hypothetical protein